MLTIQKNEVITSVSKESVRIRKLELDWYQNNYWTVAQQATVIGGFCFSQLTTDEPPILRPGLQFFYMIFTAITLGLELYVVCQCTFCSIWAPALALRGPDGHGSVQEAINYLNKRQPEIVWCFITGVVTFIVSSFFLIWIYEPHKLTCSITTLVMFVFLLIIVAYSITLTNRLLSWDEQHRSSGMRGLNQYEAVADLDAALVREDME
eukprot:Platyproteum_vivax@DN4130_c0_g1_i1.p1